jgi:D-alanyl-D-alanine dipeptidase
MKKTLALLLNALLFVTSCQEDKPVPQTSPAPVATEKQPAPSPEKNAESEPLPAENQQKKPAAASKSPAPMSPKPADDFAKHNFSDVTALDPSIKLDIRYATANNFTKSKIYDCPRCLLRPEAAKALVKAHKALQKKSLGLKMFDCYRPRPYQQRLWDKVPNPDYVTPPAKGSMHSRGAAVDLTIVDKNGKELDMGTPYDFFGKEAHTDNTSLPAHVLANRKLLREALEAVGFKGIRTEWWHFSFQGKDFPLSDYVWPCN